MITKIRTFNPENIVAYIQGNVRYKLYYSKWNFLIRTHIREQIAVRIRSMDFQCFEEGQCKMCGCTTTALQMANKPCDKPCYPRMLSKTEWWLLKKKGEIAVDNVYWQYIIGKFKIWGNEQLESIH